MLPLIVSNAEYENSKLLPGMLRGAVSIELVFRFCQNQRRKGIAELFLEGLPRLFIESVQRSGGAYLAALKRTQDAEKVTSKSAPFFDAVACRDFGVAREIARYSRGTWNRDEEYEEDFLYVWLLMKSFFLDRSNEEVASLLARYETVLDGAEDVRFLIAKGLVHHNSELFVEALNDLIVMHQDHYRTGMKRGEILEEEWATEGQLSVEGLALLRLAQLGGFTIEQGYPLIPSLVISYASENLSADSWKQLT